MSDADTLLHVARAEDLERAARDGLYRCASLETEGFIHCCEPAQLAGVVARYYAEADDLVLLVIERRALDAELRHERAPGGAERFPHVYGPIALEAVRERRAFGRRSPARVGFAGAVATADDGGAADGGGAD